MKEMGLILGTAVLLDAFLVRLVLVPAVLHIVGRTGVVAAALRRPRPAGRPIRALIPSIRRERNRHDYRHCNA